jgi:hypothetical protein
MDILGGLLVYLAGIAALFAGLALSFFVFYSTPYEPPQPKPQSASAMLVQPSTLNKPAAVEARAKQRRRSFRKTCDCGWLTG